MTEGPNGCTCGHNGDCNCPFVPSRVRVGHDAEYRPGNEVEWANAFARYVANEDPGMCAGRMRAGERVIDGRQFHELCLAFVSALDALAVWSSR